MPTSIRLDKAKRRRAATVGIAVLAVAAAGLGLRSAHPTNAATIDAMAPPSGGYLFPGIVPSPATTAASESATKRVSMPWKLSGLSADGKTVMIYYVDGDGSCTTAAGVVVRQTGKYVSIQPVSTVDTTQSACPAMIKHGWVRVTLDAPLGNRTLLHPAVAKDWQTSL